MIEIAIVEDEKTEVEKLVSYIKKYSDQYGMKANCQWFSSAEMLFKNYPKVLHLIFMDINLQGMDGMAAVKQMRERNNNVCIIFVTNLAQYAIGGYEVNAFDFILKPLNYYNFSMKFKRFCDYYTMKIGQEIRITTRDEMYLINSKEIRYVEIMKHLLTYHLVDGRNISCSGTLSNVREQLNGYAFAQCNRSCLVNLRYVKSVKGFDVIISPNESLQISRDARKIFLEHLNNYLGLGGKLR